MFNGTGMLIVGLLIIGTLISCEPLSLCESASLNSGLLVLCKILCHWVQRAPIRCRFPQRVAPSYYMNSVASAIAGREGGRLWRAEQLACGDCCWHWRQAQ